MIDLGRHAAGPIVPPQYTKIALFSCGFPSELANQRFKYKANSETETHELRTSQPKQHVAKGKEMAYMIGVDADLLVRILTDDDPIQARRTAKVLQCNDIYIAKTVLLETEWVLRYAYEIEKANIIMTP
jgi:hypothetical protein